MTLRCAGARARLTQIGAEDWTHSDGSVGGRGGGVGGLAAEVGGMPHIIHHVNAEFMCAQRSAPEQSEIYTPLQQFSAIMEVEGGPSQRPISSQSCVLRRPAVRMCVRRRMVPLSEVWLRRKKRKIELRLQKKNVAFVFENEVFRFTEAKEKLHQGMKRRDETQHSCLG